jgi:hypothetical protein
LHNTTRTSYGHSQTLRSAGFAPLVSALLQWLSIVNDEKSKEVQK